MEPGLGYEEGRISKLQPELMLVWSSSRLRDFYRAWKFEALTPFMPARMMPKATFLAGLSSKGNSTNFTYTVTSLQDVDI